MSPVEMREHRAIEGNQVSRGIKNPLAGAAMEAAAVMPIVAAAEIEAAAVETAAEIEAAGKRADEEFQWRMKSL